MFLKASTNQRASFLVLVFVPFLMNVDHEYQVWGKARLEVVSLPLAVMDDSALCRSVVRLFMSKVE